MYEQNKIEMNSHPSTFKFWREKKEKKKRNGQNTRHNFSASCKHTHTFAHILCMCARCYLAVYFAFQLPFFFSVLLESVTICRSSANRSRVALLLLLLFCCKLLLTHFDFKFGFVFVFVASQPFCWSKMPHAMHHNNGSIRGNEDE